MPERHLMALACASVVLVLCAAGPAAADDPAPEAARAETARAVVASPVAQAHVIGRRADNLGRRVASQLDEARRARDVVRVTCLDDKLAQINSVRRQIELRTRRLEERLGADAQRERHVASVLRVLDERVTNLDRGARQCVGEDPIRYGTTTVITVVDPSTPEEDAHHVRAPRSWPLPTIPPPASGFR